MRLDLFGTGDYQTAIPILTKITNDENEIEYFRGDAIKSIYILDESVGIHLAKKYKSEKDYLGEISNEILNVKNCQEYRNHRQDLMCNPTG